MQIIKQEESMSTVQKTKCFPDKIKDWWCDLIWAIFILFGSWSCCYTNDYLKTGLKSRLFQVWISPLYYSKSLFLIMVATKIGQNAGGCLHQRRCSCVPLLRGAIVGKWWRHSSVGVTYVHLSWYDWFIIGILNVYNMSKKELVAGCWLVLVLVQAAAATYCVLE